VRRAAGVAPRCVARFDSGWETMANAGGEKIVAPPACGWKRFPGSFLGLFNTGTGSPRFKRFWPVKVWSHVPPWFGGSVVIVSRGEFARWTGFSARQVGKWIADGMPVQRSARKGIAAKIDTRKAIPWLLARADEKAGSRSTLTQERQRLIAAQAVKAEIEAQQLRGALVPRQDVNIAFSECMAIIAQGLDALPGRVASQVANMANPGEIRYLLLSETRRTRQQGADRLAEWCTEQLEGTDA
jgi:phage terminase Nu1 subunit (DNA packaging protein)